MQTSILVITKIAISFVALFVLPFILVAFKIFRQQDKLYQIYVSMIIGLFSSMAVAYLLAVFGLFDKINFLILYASVVMVANLYFRRSTRKRKIGSKLKLTGGVVLLLFALAIGTYMRLYDSLQHISLGSADFYWHLQFLKNAAAGQFFASYPRGYHIILTLIYFVSNIDFFAMARFAGPFFGIVSIGAVYCSMKHMFGYKAAVFATLFYSGFAVFNYLTIEEMGFFPQGFGFLLVPLIICFVLELVNDFKEGRFRRRNILVYVFTVFLLSLVAPYAMLQMSYILLLVLFVSLAFHAQIRRSFKNVVVLVALSLLGVGIVLSYYGTLAKFRNIQLTVRTYDDTRIVSLPAEEESPEKTVSEGTEKTVSEGTKPGDEGRTVWEKKTGPASNSSIVRDSWEIAKSLLYIKRLRMPVPFPLSLGAYGGLLVSFFVLLFSMIKKRLELFTISAFTFLSGVSCMTGILELPTYQGRAGWYFMLGSIWLGGIGVKRFYDQELIRDIFHLFKRVNPLRITDKGMNTKQSRGSLIYFMVTLSGLVGYLVVTRVLGLIRLSPIRDVSLLVLIPILIFAVGRKKIDILSGERVSPSFSEKTRLYLSLHKILVVVGILVVMLYPLPRPPEYNFRYYHRSMNEDDFIRVVQEVKDKHPLSEVKLFFDHDIVLAATRKTKNMVYPQNIEIAEVQDILSGIGDKRYNFLLLDRRKEKSESFKNIMEWISVYKEQHNNVRVFYESKNIVVYLIQDYDTLDSSKN